MRRLCRILAAGWLFAWGSSLCDQPRLDLLSCRPLNSNAAQAAEFPEPVVRNIEGWQVSIDPVLFAEPNRERGERALTALANHLQRVTFLLSENRLAQLKQMPIHVDWMHELTNMQYHPNRDWLVRHGYDPRLEKHVHIPRAEQLLDPAQWAKHPYAVFHELAHAYHDQILGFDDAEIRSTFERAKQSGIYEDVLTHAGNRVKHYGLNDHKEYFAESSEAYAGVNDFFPFVRAELREHDPRMFEVMEKIWGPLR